MCELSLMEKFNQTPASKELKRKQNLISHLFHTNKVVVKSEYTQHTEGA